MDAIRLKNIKAFKDSGRIELKPLTILVGKNSCGKSTLLRFFSVFSQTAMLEENNPPISLFGNCVDFGDFEDVVTKNSDDSFTFEIEYNDYLLRSAKTNVNVNISATIKKFGERIYVEKYEVMLDDKRFAMLVYEKDDKKNQARYKLLLKSKNYEFRLQLAKDDIEFRKFFPYMYDASPQDVNEYTFEYQYNNDEGWWYSSFDANESVKKDFNVAYSDFLNLNNTLRRIFLEEAKEHIEYIGPFRKSPERIYRYSEKITNKLGANGDNVLDVLFKERHEENYIFQDIVLWIKENLGYKLDIKYLRGNYYQIVLEDGNGTQSNIIDTGYGISQVLPVIIALCIHKKYKNNENGVRDILLIEQPELHLHPAAQASLATLIESCICSNKDARLIIETHSEHLIEKLQVLIADPETKLTSDMVQFLYVDKEDDYAKIEKMELNKNGTFVNEWPTGFFDQGYNLACELLSKIRKG